MSQRKVIALGFLVALTALSPAHAGLLSINVEPVVGYERVQAVLPSPHSINRLIYGARITAGILLLSAEAEYTRGVHEESYPDLSQKITGDRLKVGLRSGFGIGSLVSVFARGGVQASQETTEQTAGGMTSTTYRPVVYRPYAGLGARVRLTSQISGTANVVAVIPNMNDFAQNEYQVTAGFAIRFP